MLKYLSILTAAIALGSVAANAQQREAVFQRIDVPNATFDIVVATAKFGSSAEYYRDQPDPNLIYLSEELVTAYTTELAEMLSVEALLHPKHTLALGRENGRKPILFYFVPKRVSSTRTAVR